MKRNMNLKRFLAFLLCAAMIITYMPTSTFTFADETSDEPVAVAEEPAPAPEPEPEPAPEPAPAVEPAAPAEETVSSEPAAEDVDEPASDAEEDAAEPADSVETVEEPVEGEPEEEEPEEAYPAFYREKSVNGMTVIIDAPEGALPEGVRVEVTPVDASEIEDAVKATMGENTEVVKAVDITFFDKDGTKIEPKVPIKVQFVSGVIDAADNASVMHIKDNGAAEMADNGDVSGSVASFESKDFSIYVVVDGEEVKVEQRTYKFVNEVVDGSASAYNFINKAGEEVDNQIIKNGDELEDVGTPRLVGKNFLGWYLLTGSNGSFAYTDTEIAFDTAISDVTATETVYVAPKYEAEYFVTFHENPKGSEDDVIQTKRVVYTSGSDANKVLISDVIAPQLDETHIFYGWVLDGTKYSIYDSSHQIQETYISGITSDVDLYPDFEEAYWLRFVSAEHGANATYIESMFVLADEEITSLPVPTRQGYKFLGWFEGSQDEEYVITYGDQVSDENGNVSPALTLTETTTLYGKWEADTGTSYHVIFWKQKVDDDKDATNDQKTYDYWKGELRNGSTNSEAKPTEADTSITTETGFHYSRYDTSSETIKADGSTTINIYYDRDLVSINFYYTSQVPGSSAAYTYTATTSQSESPQQYGVLPDGSYVELHKETRPPITRVYYTYNRNGNRITYTDTFYTRHWEWFSWEYTATEYNGDNLPPNNSTTYYTESINGNHYALTRRTETIDQSSWYYIQDGQRIAYTGTRYHRENQSGLYMITFTGLYGQSFDKYNYTWPADYRWNEQRDGQGTNQTFLCDFTKDTSAYNLYAQGSNGNNIIYHYKQNVDGTYSEDARYIAKSTENRVRFTFEDKFDGFKVVRYSNSFHADGSGTTVSAGQTVNNLYLPVHVYHERKTYNIDYNVGDTTVHSETGVRYGASLKGYDKKYTPEKEHYVFTGWYSDKNCAEDTLFDFNSTMPNSNIVLYAGFEGEEYVVKVDPDGGVITPDIGATYFTLKYDENGEENKIRRYNPVREYIEDPEGEFKYVINFSPEARTATYVTAEAGYTGTRYRKMTSADPTYTLVGWYEVINGEMSSQPYDFNEPVTKDIMIRAKWQLSGGYTLSYTPVTEVDGVEVRGTFTQTEPTAKYADLAEAIVQATPTNITPGYVFDGWEVVAKADVYTDDNVLDNNKGDYYQTGDILIVYAKWANQNRQIHIRAHYTKVEESDIPVSTTFVKYDANGGTTSVTADPDNYITVVNNVVTVDHLQINAKFTLYGASDFSKEDFELIGWNHVKAAADAGTVEFDPGQTDIAADNLTDENNTLYAVWAYSKTKIKVKITGNNDTVVFNRAEQSVEGFDYEVEGADKEDVTVSLATGKKAIAKGTNVDGGSNPDKTYPMGLTEDSFVVTPKDDNCDITVEIVEDGWLKITPAEVTVVVTGNNATMVYNGLEQSVEGFDYTATITTAEGETINVKDDIHVEIPEASGCEALWNEIFGIETEEAVAKGTDVDGGSNPDKTYPMGLSVDEFEVTAGTNYILKQDDVSVVDGWLKITPAALTITTPSANKVYNGTALTNTEGSTIDGLVNNETATVTVTGTQTDAGSSPNSYTLEWGTAKQTNYAITENVGILEVTKAPLTVMTPSASKVYDGTALTNTAGSLTGLVNNETATLNVTGSQSAVGSSSNTYTITWGTANKDNYTITENLGTLTVTPAGGDDNPPGPGPGPGPGVTPAGPVTPEVIPDEPAPAAEPETVIPDEPTPMALTWAVANLVMAILTALGAVIALCRKKEEDEDEDNMYKEEDEDDNRGKKMLASKIAGALAGVAAPITFFLTEDMSNLPVVFDKWTALMAVILAVQVVAAVFNKKASELDDDQETAEETAN